MLLVLVVCLAVWLVYGNMSYLMRINDEEELMIGRRSVVDSLIYGCLDIDNKGQAIMFGLKGSMADFDRSLDRTITIADKLKEMTDEPEQQLRIDSLKILLLQRRTNTLLMKQAIVNNVKKDYYKDKLSNLQEGKDSMVIQSQNTETQANTETVIEVTKSKKRFFKRLGDAFRRQHADTIITHRDSSKTVVDSDIHNINIADTVAGVLSDIQQEEEMLRKEGLSRIAARHKSLQMVSVTLASRIETLLSDIRKGEQESFSKAANADVLERRDTMMRVLLLAVVSLFMAAVLLYYVWRETRRERIYRENLEQAKAETERIMAQRERLLLTITHDIKAPAASISGFSELLGKQTTDTKTASYLTSIKNSALHLLHLVSQLLDYHRLEDGKVEVQSVGFSARHLVFGCVNELLPQAVSKGIDLKCDTVECGETLLRGDALRISQILENLVSNAIKYTSQGSVSVTAFVRSGKLCMTVADTGQGMTEEESRKIFDAFTRLRGAQGIEGVGLGLSITKELVELLGGRISLQSTKGKGTVFKVVIPVETTDIKDVTDEQKDVLGRVKGVSEDAKDVVLSGERHEVIVIDDDPLQLKLLTEMLERLTNGAWNVVACRQVDEGLQLIDTKRFDVLITDIEMPAMSGKELIGKIDHEGIAIVGMTAHERDIEPSLLQCGFDACLFKPFTISELADVLSKVTGSEVVNQNEQTETLNSQFSTHNLKKINDSKPLYQFSQLTAFAAGDEAAEREILSCFKTDLVQNAASLRSALAANDRETIGKIAHKALPSMAMVSADCAELLRRLSPREIGNASDDDMKKYVSTVVGAMTEMAEELTDSTINT